MIAEPTGNARHVGFEHPTREIEHASPLIAAVLEVMRHPAGHEHKGTCGRVDPLRVDEKTHRSLDHEEHIVFGMRVPGPVVLASSHHSETEYALPVSAWSALKTAWIRPIG